MEEGLPDSGDRPPISTGPLGIRKTLLKALCEKQILLLDEIRKNNGNTITSLLTRISSDSKIPISTLKRNAIILKRLDLVQYSDFMPAKLTKAGKIVLDAVGGEP